MKISFGTPPFRLSHLLITIFISFSLRSNTQHHIRTRILFAAAHFPWKLSNFQVESLRFIYIAIAQHWTQQFTILSVIFDLKEKLPLINCEER